MGYKYVGPNDIPIARQVGETTCCLSFFFGACAVGGIISAIVTDLGIRIGIVPYPSLWATLGIGLGVLLVVLFLVCLLVYLIACMVGRELYDLFIP